MTSTDPKPPRLAVWLRQLRAPFFTASIVPVVVGSTAGFAVTGSFEPVLFVLALAGIVCMNAGTNMANDYFDHTSGNDWANKNPTPFSGGSRLIQQDLLSPRAVLIAAWIAFGLALVIGIVILLIIPSLFIVTLGIVGLLGGYFYTAGPIRLGYRGAGEILIALLLGLGPVYGAYFLQTGSIGLTPLGPAIVVSLLIFLVILINEFPDAGADAAVNKKTLVVILGPKTAAWIYTAVVIISYLAAITVVILQPQMRLAGLLYLVTIPLAVSVLKFLRKDTLGASGKYRPNRLTILLHLSGGMLISLGLVITGVIK